MDKELLETIKAALNEEGLRFKGVPFDLKRFKVVYPLTDEDFSEDEVCEVRSIQCLNAFYWVRSKFAGITNKCQCNYNDYEWIVIYYTATMRVLYTIYFNPEEDKTALDKYTIDILSSFGFNNVKW